MPEPSAGGAAVVPVTIYGRTYHLRGIEGSAYLEELARIVDDKMRELADAGGAADTLKLAILTALNLADESLKARRGPSPSADADGGVDRRMAAMVTLLDEVLAEQAEDGRRAGGSAKGRG